MRALCHLPACAIAAVLLPGCMSLQPAYQRPALPVPAEYPAAPAGGATAADIPWRDYFTDARLRALIAQALAHNRELRLAVLRMEEARALYQVQRADRFPGIDIDGQGMRSRVPADLSATGAALTGGQYQLAVGLNTWELDFWGRVRSLQDAALQTYLATDAARRAATISLIAQVADGYLALQALDERLLLARRTIATRAQSLQIFRRRAEAGSISRLDLTQVEVLWQQARSLAAQLEQERAAQEQALQLLAGSPLPIDTSAAQTLDDAALMRELAPGLPADLLANRPDIAAAEHRLQAANANIGAARAAFFPRIALTGAYGTASAELDGLFDGGSRAWRFAPSVALPLFDGGRNRASLDLAQVRRGQAVASYEQAIQQAFREVADALAARRWLGEQVRLLRATVALQDERARLARLRYDHGAVPFLEVLDAERELLDARQQLVQLRRALLGSRVHLYAALGGSARQMPAAGPAPDSPTPEP
ncbi:efflux transporter outer membrane subunit [Bordetella petrii]|uniref:Efflux transporter outer membrane subunit n=1 Tax=Bordetella petrii TaxID=94624 RepID=A0ABT7W5E5_9BORD|nr:efflux transporter outer membrane subunit [Bordetella petrii]MDM9560411.1 efflux transporter outer membrane subunit [Bordetella petrii]